MGACTDVPVSTSNYVRTHEICISAFFFREQDLTSYLAEFKMDIDDLMDDLDSYDVNITRAEETVDSLFLQANRTKSLLQQLTSLVRSLEIRVNEDLRLQLTDLLTLNEQLTRQVSKHIGAVTTQFYCDLRNIYTAA